MTASWTPWAPGETDTRVRFHFAPGSVMPDDDCVWAEVGGDVVVDPAQAQALKEKARALMVARNGVVNAMMDAGVGYCDGYAVAVQWGTNKIVATASTDEARAVLSAGGFSPLVGMG